MAVSFTDKERAGIIATLRKAAGRCAASVGMKKTTVDELALEAGISKGAFYKFYPSKEHLFLDMLEQWYQSIYDSVAQVLRDNASAPPRQRASLMLKVAWRSMRDQPLVRFSQEDIPLLLRKLPESLLCEHYQSVDDFISNLIDRSGILLTVPKSEACAVVKILFFSLPMASKVGTYFDEALDGLIDGSCSQMIQED